MEQWMNRRMKHAKRAQKYKEIELTLDWLQKIILDVLGSEWKQFFLSPTSAICLV